MFGNGLYDTVDGRTCAINKIEYQGPGSRLLVSFYKNETVVIPRTEIRGPSSRELSRQDLESHLTMLGIDPGFWSSVPARQVVDKMLVRALGVWETSDELQRDLIVLQWQVEGFNQIFVKE